MDSGPCTLYMQRWHFDSTLGYCKPFSYGGCQGNKNRFQSNEQCREACVSEDVTPTDEPKSEPEPEPSDFGE